MAKVKKNHKLVVEVEDVGEGECVVTPRGSLTIETSSVLMTIATLYCMGLSGLTFDLVVERLREEVARSKNPFEDLTVVPESQIN
jgi:hypothetical protein